MEVDAMETKMENKCVLVETTDHIATLTINRPESLNSLNSEVLEELDRALEDLERDSVVKVVVLTGAGSKAFVAGGDIKEMLSLEPPSALAFSRKGQQLLLRIGRMSKPVIAAVNGYALGGGLELALACDFIYASENAKLGLPETTLGVIPGFGGTQNLPRLIGPNKAREMIFSGKMLSAAEALEWGLVNKVFPVGELLPNAMETARTIAKNGMVAVANAKDAILNGLNMDRENGLRYESSLFGTLFASHDQKEGMQAFVEKRKAEFKGN
jgi:enoyl-CoA hydratase